MVSFIFSVVAWPSPSGEEGQVILNCSKFDVFNVIFTTMVVEGELIVLIRSTTW